MTSVDAVVTLADVKANSVTIDSATQITAVWTKGIPVTNSSNTDISIMFDKTDSFEMYWADTQNIVLENTLSVSGSTTALSCSFNGGCKYEVTSSGLSSILAAHPSENYISVCDSKCEYSPDDSTPTKAVCKLPKLSTLYSNTNFEISIPNVGLNSGRFFGMSSNPSVAFNGKLDDTYKDTNTNCHIGMEFKQGHVAILS
jgi:hypothetical protein